MSSWPTLTGSGESVFVSDRSAGAITVVVTKATLSPSLGSIAADETEAEFEISPALCTWTTICTEAEEEGARVPRSHVTAPEDSLQVPCVGVADWYVTPAGSASKSVTEVAAEGPALATSRL